MVLANCVSIAQRFQRSVRIDTDHVNEAALNGFICPQSSEEVLRSVARHVQETGHGAFTWTGPYGSGKSTLVVALSALLGGSNAGSERSSRTIGKDTASFILRAMPRKTRGWRIVPVVGHRGNAAQVIGEALETAGGKKSGRKKNWTDAHVIHALTELSQAHPRAEGGLLLFIDEMGKFLESSAQDGEDIYIFQLLAEAASRSCGRLIVVGILHQSFEEYSNRLSREMRDEWSKIQGRFIDLAVDTSGEEQIELIARAIENGRSQPEPGKLATKVADCIRRQRPSASKSLEKTLEAAWPLHPVVCSLLGPISRRRFGQNQRSIFGFLNSAEPYAFQDFIHHGSDDDRYNPDRLWDYLRVNLEPSILASPDGHRWATASEAIERCEGLGGDVIHIQLLKSVALIDLFKERSGLTPSLDLLCACLPEIPKKDIRKALDQLRDWSLIVFRKFADSYAVFAGSDFNIERAVQDELEIVREIDFSVLQQITGLQPILAKRHYHETGALRWFDVQIAPVNEISERARSFTPQNGTIGLFMLAIPTDGESDEVARKKCKEAARCSEDWDIVAGLSSRAWSVTDLARELIALNQIQDEHPDLAGDTVAQREVNALHAALQGQLEENLRRAFDHATWYIKNKRSKTFAQAEINGIASELADSRYNHVPRLHNELVNRIKPSSNAIAAQNALLRRMVTAVGTPRLGIEGFPAEGGLFASLLEATHLYRKRNNRWLFAPPISGTDPCGLKPLWKSAEKLLKDATDRTVSVAELYDLWAHAPYGLKPGLMPILAVAFILSRGDAVALYRQGVFQARFKDIDVDILTNDPTEIQLRWMDLSELSKKLLSGMAEIVRELDETNTLADLAPIDVARGLIAIYDRLHTWTKRTMHLSSNAVRVRDIFNTANDPNKFLFDDIPSSFGGPSDLGDETTLDTIVKDVRDGLEELARSYPSMLRRLCDLMLAELQVPNDSAQSITELRERAENIRQLGGDYRLDAFVGRIAQYTGSYTDVEGIASLAANKPPRDWIDLDLDKAAIEITDLAQKFIRAENFARVKGRTDKRHAMAVIVGVDGRPAPVHEEFDIADADRDEVDTLIARVEGALEGANHEHRNVILAALAEVSARYMMPGRDRPSENRMNERAV